LQPAFSSKRFEAYGREVTDAARSYLESRVGTGEAIVNFEQAMIELTTKVICRPMFGVDLGPQVDDVR